MYVSMSEHSLMLLYSVLLGLFLGAAYDIVRLTRIAVGVKYGAMDRTKYDFGKYALIGSFFYSKVKKKVTQKDSFLSLFIFLGDVLFCLFCSVSVAIFIYYFNSGEFRAFVLVGAFVGFLIYYFSFGKIVIYLSEKIIFTIKLLLLYVVFFLLFPFYYLFLKTKRIFWIIIQKNILIIKKTYDIMYVKHYTKRCKRDVLYQASFGFLKDYVKK